MIDLDLFTPSATYTTYIGIQAEEISHVFCDPDSIQNSHIRYRCGEKDP